MQLIAYRRKALNRANEKRYAKVTELFKHSRARAEQEHKQTIENGRLESLSTNKHIKHSNISSSNDINNKSNQLKEAPKLHKRQNDRRQKRTELSQISSKRIDLRQTKTSLLLQDRLKERTNARYYDKIIERARKSREDEQRAISRVAESRENEYRAYERLQSSIKAYGRKISGAFARAREKALNTINEMKEKLGNFGKLKQDDNLEKLVNLS